MNSTGKLYNIQDCCKVEQGHDRGKPCHYYMTDERYGPATRPRRL